MHNFQVATNEYVCLRSFTLQNEGNYWIKKKASLSTQKPEGGLTETGQTFTHFIFFSSQNMDI